MSDVKHQNHDELVFYEENVDEKTANEPVDAQNEPWKIIIADDEEEVHNITRMVLQGFSFEKKELHFLHAYSAKETKKLINEHPDISIILLDVVMETDSAGLEMVHYIRKELNNHIVQIILRTGQAGQVPEQEAVEEYEINDYKSKQELTAQKLLTTITSSLRAYRLANSYNRLNEQLHTELMERKEIEKKLKQTLDEVRSLSLTDDLTGLYNRRGFLTLARQQLKFAHRIDKLIVLFYTDMDNLKLINDNMGHKVGDHAIIETANLIRSNFREADIIARLGGDEFVILSVDTYKEDEEIIVARLLEKFEEFNVSENKGYKLSVSIGMAQYDPSLPCTVEELLERADRMMYKDKQKKKPGPDPDSSTGEICF
ncbi:MAG: diguanylate cyclase [bacterium]|nr:diguanylate cyclase [bacterium]